LNSPDAAKEQHPFLRQAFRLQVRQAWNLFSDEFRYAYRHSLEGN